MREWMLRRSSGILIIDRTYLVVAASSADTNVVISGYYQFYRYVVFPKYTFIVEKMEYIILSNRYHNVYLDRKFLNYFFRIMLLPI